MKGRVAVPALLAALLVVQIASIIPARERARTRIVEAVYRAPSRALGAVLDPETIESALADAMRKASFRSSVKPSFEVSSTFVTVRFGLIEGDAGLVVRELEGALALAGSEALAMRLANDVPSEMAFACRACVSSMVDGAWRALDRPQHRFTLLHYAEYRAPWLRPVDLLAAGVYLVCFLIWMQAGRRREAGGGVDRRQE